jgi:hypothetical protein
MSIPIRLGSTVIVMQGFTGLYIYDYPTPCVCFDYPTPHFHADCNNKMQPERIVKGGIGLGYSEKGFEYK